MARHAHDGRLDTRSTRRKLAVRPEPYWAKIDHRLYLGYRRTTGEIGTWIARRYDPVAKTRQTYKAIGSADDLTDSDGQDVLTFYEAQDTARDWNRRIKGSSQPAPGRMTVANACEAYVEYLRSEKTSANDVDKRLKRLVISAIGDCRINDLTVKQLRKLRNDIVAKTLERKRGQGRPNTSDLDQFKKPDSEAERRAKVNANRVMAMLKAALNRAYNELENGIHNDTAWRRVSPFKGVDRAREVHLDQEQCQRLITAAGGYIPKQRMRTGMKPILHPDAFQNLVIATLLTGARPAPGEIAHARVRDFRADLATLSIFKSKTGPRVIVLTKEAVSFFKHLSADRNPDDVLLPNYYGLQWGYNQQIRPMKEAVKRAELPAGTCMYSLRHTYASQSLMSGMNLKLLAENMGTSIKMLEEHYAKFLQAKKQELIEETSFNLGLTPSDVTIRRPRGSA